MAGFTTVRDLGTEGAMYDDVSLKKSIDKYNRTKWAGDLKTNCRPSDDRCYKSDRTHRNLWP